MPLTQTQPTTCFSATSFATIAVLHHAPTVRRYLVPKLVLVALRRVESRTASPPKRTYSMRRGQDGQLVLRNGKWLARYYVDVNVDGQPKRQRKATI